MRKKLDQFGFSLIELMVVVGIMGIMAALAVPSYKKSQARSRQIEAKLALAGIYSSLNNYLVEKGSFTLCLNEAGLVVDATPRNYSVGVGLTRMLMTCGPSPRLWAPQYSDPPTNSIPIPTNAWCEMFNWDDATKANSSACFTGASGLNSIASPTSITNTIAQGNSNAWGATQSQGMALSTVNAGVTGTALDRNTFIAKAAGNILSGAANLDTWTMDQTKTLSNTIDGTK